MTAECSSPEDVIHFATAKAYVGKGEAYLGVGEMWHYVPDCLQFRLKGV